MSLPTIHKDFKLNETKFESVSELLIFAEKLNVDIAIFLAAWFNSGDFVEVVTSGSTGKPKTIKLGKKTMQHSAEATAHFFNLHNKTKALLCMSPKFIAGKMMLVRALENGWHLDVVEPKSNPLEKISTKYDFAAMVPLQVENSIIQLNQVDTLIIGGAAISNALLNKIQQIDCNCFATYGMTETATHIAVKKLNNFSKNSNSVKSNFKTLPNIEVDIDERNCLVINAPNLISEKIVTNDVVKLISATEFKWIGRYDNVINSAGVKLFPEEIEEKISSLIKDRFFVAGLPHKSYGEELVLIIESSDKKYKAVIEQLKTLQLSKYQIPKKVFFVNKFIETSTQKIQRKETLKLLKSTC